MSISPDKIDQPSQFATWDVWCLVHRVSYITQDVKVGTEQYIASYKHHDAVTEQYIDYYTCSCGATK